MPKHTHGVISARTSESYPRVQSRVLLIRRPLPSSACTTFEKTFHRMVVMIDNPIDGIHGHHSTPSVIIPRHSAPDSPTRTRQALAHAQEMSTLCSSVAIPESTSRRFSTLPVFPRMDTTSTLHAPLHFSVMPLSETSPPARVRKHPARCLLAAAANPRGRKPFLPEETKPVIECDYQVRNFRRVGASSKQPRSRD